MAAYFAAFSSIMNSAVRARVIPATPCTGIRVTSGYEVERLVATPTQALRAAMRLHEAGLGLGGFLLCILDLFTGARWGELAGQERHEYDEVNKAIGIREPLKETAGRLFKGGQEIGNGSSTSRNVRRRVQRGAGTKTPASTRWVKLPPSLAALYELLLDSREGSFAFVSPDGLPWHRSNFRMRFWRPSWDGRGSAGSDDHLPPILLGFTFHEGRHSHSTWLVQDRVPEVARRARLGHKMQGIARAYEHVTPEMEAQILDALEARWNGALAGLTVSERSDLVRLIPELRQAVAGLEPASEADVIALG